MDQPITKLCHLLRMQLVAAEQHRWTEFAGLGVAIRSHLEAMRSSEERPDIRQLAEAAHLQARITTGLQREVHELGCRQMAMRQLAMYRRAAQNTRLLDVHR